MFKTISLSAKDLAFIERRKRLARYWPWTGVTVLLGLLGYVVWLWFSSPLLINPWAVFDALEKNTLAQSTLVVMAAMLPILMLSLVVFMVVIVALLFQVMAREKRLIRLIEKEENPPDSQRG